MVIAAADVDQVAARARQRVEKENTMLKALREKQTTVDLLGLRGVLDRVAGGS